MGAHLNLSCVNDLDEELTSHLSNAANGISGLSTGNGTPDAADSRTLPRFDQKDTLGNWN